MKTDAELMQIFLRENDAFEGLRAVFNAGTESALDIDQISDDEIAEVLNDGPHNSRAADTAPSVLDGATIGGNKLNEQDKAAEQVREALEYVRTYGSASWAEDMIDRVDSALSAPVTPAAEQQITAEQLLRHIYKRPDLTSQGRESFIDEMKDGDIGVSLCWGDFLAMAELANQRAATPPAQDVREAFEQHWYDFYHSGSVKARPDGTYMHTIVQAAWDAFKAGAALSQQDSAQQDSGDAWISVDERLPEENVAVLVAGPSYNDLEKNGHFFVVARHVIGKFFDDGSGGDIYPPTHWKQIDAPAASQPSDSKEA